MKNKYTYKITLDDGVQVGVSTISRNREESLIQAINYVYANEYAIKGNEIKTIELRNIESSGWWEM